jgi:leader peptidase (prepilin peptidase)/N-methyltransferase
VSLHTFLLLYVGAVGLIVGSYLNVVIHRLPRRQSTVLPASRCPFCGLRLRPWQNIPVLSFFLLGRRCARCRSPIAWRYPLVEALTAVLFVLCAVRFGLTPAAALAAIFCATLVALAGIDLDHLILPDRLTLPGAVLALLAHFLLPWALPWATPLEALLGAVLGAAIPLALSAGWYLLRRVHGMGLGDVKMLAFVGAFLGWRGALVTLTVAAFAALALVVVRWPLHRYRAGHKIPFGPFLALGAAVALLAGEALVAGYLRLAWGAGIGG